MDLSQHKVDVYCKLLQVSDFRHTSHHHTTAAWQVLVAGRKLMSRNCFVSSVWTNPAAALGAADVTSRVWQFPIWCKRFRDIWFNKTGRGKSGAPWFEWSPTGHQTQPDCVSRAVRRVCSCKHGLKCVRQNKQFFREVTMRSIVHRKIVAAAI